MNKSIDNGGDTHIRYAHFHYPNVIHLKCPKCEGTALAGNIDAQKDIEHFMDIADFQKIWEVQCLKCSFRATANWQELKAFELLLIFEIRGIYFWAWNPNHLKMILKRLKKEDLKSDKWEPFATYIPRKWLSNLDSDREIRKIENLLENSV